MYAICRTAHPATVVEHSCYCHFFNFDERNLVTAGLNQLKIYRLIQPKTDAKYPLTNEENEEEDGDTFSNRVKLECMQTFSLNANIESLNSVTFVGANRDCLILAFKDAKLSIVEYDPGTHDLKTISLHYFEDDDMKNGYNSCVRPPLVRVDPENRCAAMLVYNKNIVIIPFRKDVVDDNKNASFLSTFNSSSAAETVSAKKLPVLPSYKLPLTHEQYGVNIVNILDIEFLHNYYEPTLLILYEPIQTWPGRVAVRQDTVSMITLSLDVHQRVHPHIWSLNNLPYNTFAALPVPKPIGGVLIFATNALIHLNQGLPPYGISLNSFNNSNTSFPLKTQENVLISLDCCQAAFIANDKIILSLNDGEIYVLQLYNDMTRSVRTYNFTHLASSVASTTLTKCEEGFIFIGARLSHSILVQYYRTTDLSDDPVPKTKAQILENGDNSTNSTMAASNNTNTNNNNLMTTIPGFNETDQTEDQYLYGDDYCDLQKRPKLETPSPKEEEKENLENNTNGDENENEIKESDTEQIDKQQNGEQTDDALPETSPTEEMVAPRDIKEILLKVHKSDEKSIPLYSLRLCDIINNIGPCGSVCFGEPYADLENMAAYQDLDVDLATTCGYFKAGGITVLQRSIKPQIETSFKLPGSVDCWTAYGPNYFSEGTQTHKYLILSQDDSTLVFQIGQEINELEQSGFITQSPTVFAGNLGDNKYILQVCANSVRLLDGIREVQHFPIDIGSPLVRVSIADPYSVLMSQKGVVILLCLKIDPINHSARLVVTKPDLSKGKSQIVSLCIYRDISALFTTQTKNPESVDVKQSTKKKKQTVVAPSLTSTLSNFNSVTTIDEEDELLYGNSVASFLNTNHANSFDEDEEKDEVKIKAISKAEPTFWLFIVRENGIMEIYNLPEFKLVYLVKNFPLGLRVLVDSVQTTDHSHQSDTLTLPQTKEILVCGLGVENTRPFLFARFEEDLFIYEIFPFYESQVEGHLKIRFKKVTSHCQFVKIPRIFQMSGEDQKLPAGFDKRSWLRPFTNVGQKNGVFLCGPYPCWFFMTHRGELRAHSMESDGQIISFAMFNNVNCPDGYLYFNINEELRFAVLSQQFDIDSHWPSRHIPFDRTVHFINYHLESKTYAVVTSRLLDITRIVRIGGEEKDYDNIEADSRYIPCKTEQFELQLLSPVNWTIIPGTLVEMDEWEHCTCLKSVMLASEGTSSGLKGYIAIGTNYSYGEDVTNRGRIWILDIIEVVPEPGKPLTKNKIKIVYCKEQKGPVTALCQVRGYLLSAIGQKIYIWTLKETQLIGIAFIDTQIYVHTAVSLRNLILVGDICKSISLLRYQEETRTLSLVSRDHKSLQIYACDYLIDNSQMSFVVSDADKNIIVYIYQPEIMESLGGTRLLRRADFHLGSCVNAFFRIRCRIPSNDIDPSLKLLYLRRHITMYATLDGSIGYLLPIMEKSYRRLFMLQNLLNANIQHRAGLNPKAFRLIKSTAVELINPCKNILDGDLLYQYLNLSLSEKIEMAKKIGTSTRQIIEDLQEAHCISSHF